MEFFFGGYLMTERFPPEVAAVRQQFEDWRATQTQKGPLPKALWQAAAALLPRFPLALVARACRLNPSKLKQFATGQAPKPKAAPAIFRTLTRETLQQAAALVTPPAAEVRFVLERPDGTRLVITCPPQPTELAAALCRQLLGNHAPTGKKR
jgi:hypothetical protein